MTEPTQVDPVTIEYHEGTGLGELLSPEEGHRRLAQYAMQAAKGRPMTNLDFARRLSVISQRAASRIFDALVLSHRAHDEVDMLLARRTCLDLKKCIDALIDDAKVVLPETADQNWKGEIEFRSWGKYQP